MATVIRRGNGHHWVGFSAPDGRRPVIRLGKISYQQALDFKRRVERLLAAKAMGQPPDLDTAQWVASLSPAIHARLAATGLVEERGAATVGEMLDDFLATAAVKASTKEQFENVAGNVRTFFGTSRQLAAITEADADKFRRWLLERGGDKGEPLAPTTVSRRCGRAKQMFLHAVRHGWIRSNPLAPLARGKETNRSRDRFIRRDEVAKVLEAIPSPEFRAVVALVRYGGLRCPSEVQPLRWSDVNWEHGTLRVVSSKTERHESGIRSVPLFPELRQYIDEWWHARPEHGELMFPSYQLTGTAYRKQLHFACDRAHVERWRKPWGNMRKTRETELFEEYPIHVVAAWMGHSPEVALRHYAMVLREHYARAAVAGEAHQKAHLQPAATAFRLPTVAQKTPSKPRNKRATKRTDVQ